MKILIFGGAFDPPHLGHKALLKAAIDEIAPDLTLVVPSKESPHKVNSTRAFRHRRRMCSLFLDCGKVKISSIERWRRGASYTVDTVEAFNRRYPDSEFYLLVGTDMLEYFEKWRDYRRLLELCTLVAGSRDDGDLLRLEAAAKGLIAQGGRVIVLKNRVTEVSSTEIRKVLADGNKSPLLDPDTADYIQRHGLYKE